MERRVVRGIDAISTIFLRFYFDLFYNNVNKCVALNFITIILFALQDL
jgi:hypothetical protein